MINKDIIDSIKEFQQLNNKLLSNGKSINNEDLERYFCKFEQERMRMYNMVRQENLFLKLTSDKEIQTIDNDYYAKIEDGILKINIPEKIPSIKKGMNYAQQQMIYNISKVTSEYEGYFGNKSVLVIIHINDSIGNWDADNRNIKPIQDGLVHGKVINDDNIHNCSYMVQGFFSCTPYTSVYVVESNRVLDIIYNNLGIYTWENF